MSRITIETLRDPTVAIPVPLKRRLLVSINWLSTGVKLLSRGWLLVDHC